MEKTRLLNELETISQIACRAMRKYDGQDIAKIPEEYRGYREIYSRLQRVFDQCDAEE